MSENIFRLIGVIIAILASTIYLYTNYSIISLLLLCPSMILMASNLYISNFVIKTLDFEFSEGSTLKKLNEINRWVGLRPRIKKIKGIHAQAAATSLIYGLVISALFIGILLLIFIIVALILSKNNLVNNSSGAKKMNSNTNFRSSDSGGGGDDTMLSIEVCNPSGHWVPVSSAYPNEKLLSERLRVVLRSNPNSTRARAIGNKTGRIYDIM